MDCWGLVVAAERELFGKELPSLDCRYTSAYDRKTAQALINETRPVIGALEVDPPETGDVAVIAF